MMVLDCDECQGASLCEIPQKASGQPCPSIEPMHCGLSMRHQGAALHESGPHISFSCTKCGETGTAYTSRPPPPPRRSFTDPILPILYGKGIPDTLE